MFKAGEKKIKDLLFLDDGILKIPKYQRPYTWSKDETEDFWEDTIGHNNNFFGTFILSSESNERTYTFEVIDGQQRLLTITIFLAVLRDYAKTLGYKELAGRIQRKTIVYEDISGKINARLIVGESLKNFFQKFIQSENQNPITPDSKEEKLISINYEIFSEKLREYLKDTEKDKVEEKIQNIINKIAEIDCVAIYVTSDEDAYSIFETVNARGVDLSVGDLLKNLLFKDLESRGEIKFGQEQWSRLAENVQEASIELQKFLRYFWLSKYSFISEKDLYKTIKNKKLDPKQLIGELVHSSELYLKIASNNPDDWTDYEYGNKIRKSLHGIEIMGATQCHVLFLSILRNADHFGRNLIRVFTAVENFTFLYSAVSKLQANKIEKLYSKYAIKFEVVCQSDNPKNIVKELQRTIEEFLSDLHQLKPAAALFDERFSQIAYKNSEKGRKLISYILSGMESHKTMSEMSINFEVVNIEHLIPQNPSKEWNVTKREIKDYVNMLGNLVLVHKDYNSRAGNKSLKEKCEILKNTKISMTRDLIDEIIKSDYLWSQNSIIERQKQLSQLAYEIWAF